MVSFDSFTSSVTSRRVPFGGYILTVSSRPFHVDGFISGFYSAVKFWTVLLRRLHRFDGSSRPFHFSVISAVSFWTAPFARLHLDSFISIFDGYILSISFRRLHVDNLMSVVMLKKFLDGFFSRVIILKVYLDCSILKVLF